MADSLFQRSDGTASPLKKRDRLASLAAALLSVRKSGFDSHWAELAEFILPRRVRFQKTGDKDRGDKRNSRIINSTATFSARTLAAGLHAGLTSPARPWMKLTTPDPDLAKHPPVRAWLHEVTTRTLTVFAQTNLYNAFPITYGDLGTFGSAAQAMLPDDKDLFRCFNYALGTWAVGVNNRGVVDTFVREYESSVRNVVMEFGVVRGTTRIEWSRISQTVKDAWDKGDYFVQVPITWVVCPNEDYEPGGFARKGMKFGSYHFESGSNEPGRTFLRESGYYTFPVQVPRWEVTDGDAYGTNCPGMTALGDVKQLQIMERRKGQAIAKMVDPPLTGPSALRTQKTSLLPGDITYLDVREGQQGLKSIHDVNLRVDHLAIDIGNVEYRIQRAYYEDLFLMLARSDARRGAQPPTAREVEERHEEKLIALGPVLESTNDELLDPIVDRAYEMMDRAGLIPKAPEVLQGVDLKVEYISILAQAQKLVSVVGLDRMMQSALTLAPVFPGVVHKIDSNEVIDEYAETLGINPRIIRSNEAADESAAAIAAAQKGALDAQVMKDTAAAMHSAGNTPMDENTALSRIVGGAANPAAA
jgi:hypothetical protein